MPKICSKCKESKAKKYFSKTTRRPDGFSGQCKQCVQSYRDDKIQVSKEYAEDFVKSLSEKGITFKCKNCEEVKLSNEFYYKRDYGKVKINTSKCKSCQQLYQRFKTFGITEDQYNVLLKNQNNSCAICNITEESYRIVHKRNNVFAIDHCHLTGNIRGLLCSKCNTGIGQFDDSIENLFKAIYYLKG